MTYAAGRVVARQALKIAEAYAAAHVHEEGGNNRGDQVEFFQHLLGGSPGDPWCADFASTCLVKGFAQVSGLDESRDALPGYLGKFCAAYLPLSGSCMGLWAAGRRRMMNRAPSFAPLAGDLVLFDFEGRGEPHHVGLVVSAAGSTVQTVEGNTSSGLGGSQADGDGVFCRTRPTTHVFGFIHF